MTASGPNDHAETSSVTRGHTPARDGAEPDTGPTIGGYVLTGRTLGRGGFGIVYEGKHATLDRTVAIKVQAADCSAPDADARLIEEAKLVARMRHPNIVDLFDIGTLPDGRVYLIMELLEGVTLQAHLAAVGPMTIGAAQPILTGIASALDAIHAKGFAHRDVKPANVMLIRDQAGAMHAKLLDFGIAKALDPAFASPSLTTPGTMIGTPPFMSPEQCLGELVRPASDVYALGVVAFRMLTGTLPFTGTPVDVYHAHVHTPAPAPSSRCPGLDARLDAPVLAMLAKAIEDRPPSAVDAIAALSLPVSYIDQSTRPGDALAAPKSRARGWFALAGAGVALVAGAAIVVLLHGDGKEPQASVEPARSPSPPPAATRPVDAREADAGEALEIPVDASPPAPGPSTRPHPPHPRGRGSAGKVHQDDLEALPEAYRDHAP